MTVYGTDERDAPQRWLRIMLIGILSDTHGRHLAARRAMELFQRSGVEHVIHCGDVGGVSVFEELLVLPCTFVWGNTDVPDRATLAFLEKTNLHGPEHAPALCTLNGKTFAVFHGHEPEFEQAPFTMKVDYILHGHTHVPRDERVNHVRIINPGALHRARRRTVATLDTQTDELIFHEIDTQA